MSEAEPTVTTNDDSPVATPTIIFKQRGARSRANVKKRLAPPPGPDQSDSSASSDDDTETLSGARAKRKKHGTTIATSTIDVAQTRDHGPSTFRADRDVPLSDTNDATKRRDWYDKPSKIGPKPMSNVRLTTIMDFKPDVCKDYQRTGWCGYGDACVFLHDRSDMKQGWQLDKEWEDITKGREIIAGTVVASAGRKKADRDGEDEDDDTKVHNIPFACIICTKPYRTPVVTACRHYFCESCALKRYSKDPSCAACGANTRGIFNSASTLENLLKRKKVQIDDA
ncbi:hypothetical protein V8C35DRAFT_308440 [Trichoderma chlorosporum]